MPSKRDVLAHLTRDDRLSIIDLYELAVPNRCVRDGLVDGIASHDAASDHPADGASGSFVYDERNPGS